MVKIQTFKYSGAHQQAMISHQVKDIPIFFKFPTFHKGTEPVYLTDEVDGKKVMETLKNFLS